MLISDFESHLLNSVAEEDEIQQFIEKEVNDGIESVEQAEEKISAYVKMMKQMKKLLDTEKQNNKREGNKRKEIEYVRDTFYSSVLQYHELTITLCNQLTIILENTNLVDPNTLLDLHKALTLTEYQSKFDESQINALQTLLGSMNL